MSLDGIKLAAVKLPEANDNILDQNCQISGWGKTENGMQSAILLKAASTQASSNLRHPACRQARQQNKAFCGMGPNTQGTCQGDSGGPFTCKNSQNEPVLYGLTSYGIWGCGSEGMPDFYTNVREFLPWIKQKSGVGSGAATTTGKPVNVDKPVPDNGLPDCNPHHAIWHDRDGDSCQDYYDRNWCRLPEGDMTRYANDGYSALNCPDCNKCNKVASDSSPWGKWGACSTTCGSDGTQTRTKEDGSDSEQRSCVNQKECPSEWGEWSACDKSCGGGHSLRTRVHNGYTQINAKWCNVQACSVNNKCNPNWPSWTDISGHRNCDVYARAMWCSPRGYGSRWNSAWGNFERYGRDGFSASNCPQCGCTP